MIKLWKGIMDFLKLYFLMLGINFLAFQFLEIHFIHLYFETNRFQMKVGLETT